MKHEAIARRIIEKIGRQDNIQNIWHFMTRLHFKLKNHEIVDHEALMNEQAVVGVNNKSDQLQVVIGTDVAEYYETMVALLGMDTAEDATSNEEEEAKSLITSFMAIVSRVFGPIVPVKGETQWEIVK